MSGYNEFKLDGVNMPLLTWIRSKRDFLEPVADHAADLLDAADKKIIKRTKLSGHI